MLDALIEWLRGWRDGYKRKGMYEICVVRMRWQTDYTATIRPVTGDSYVTLGTYPTRAEAMRQAEAALESWSIARFSVGKMQK